ncbi:MAG: sigma-54 dependent transcriptional regulator [Nitrospirota bacterium]
MPKPMVLVVDDEEGIRESLSDIFADEGYRVASARSGAEALEKIESEPPDLVLLDIWLPEVDGLEVLERIKERIPGMPVIMISGHGNIEMAVRATKNGAYDFLEKPLSLERVVLVAQRALERSTLETENRTLRESLTKRWLLIGETPAMKTLRRQVESAAKGHARVLITGESGTGKEVVARRLHALSPRADKPFVEVNCAAIPQELIESELFGHEKGSFTGAFERKRGKFEMADGGTLFLDEIADMSPQTQAKLLRVIEMQQFQRVGGSKDIKVDVRVMAATNRDIPARIKEGLFRDDLYFRLNVIPITTPPLRQRIEDIPLLVDHFLGLLAAEYGQPKKSMTPEAVKRLKERDWPGNIRELRNLIERLVLMTPSDTIGEAAVLEAGGEAPSTDYFEMETLKDAREAFERDFLADKLREHNFNVSRTAEALGIERSNLHRKIKAYGIKIP